MAEEKDLLKSLERKKDDARKYRQQFEQEWKSYENFYHGDQWRFAKKRPVKNWVFTIVETEVPVLTDSRPGTDVLPLQVEDQERAEVLEAGIHSVYENERLILKQSQAVRSALITGTGWLYVDYDPDKDEGDGNVTVSNIPWRHVWVDPKATEIDEAQYAIIEVPQSVEDLKRKFPGKEDVIMPSGKNKDFFGEQRKDGTKSDRWTPTMGNQSPVGRFDSNDIAILEEYWIKDYEQVPVPLEETEEEVSLETDQFLQGINPDIHKYEDHQAHITAHMLQKLTIASELLQKPEAEVRPEEMELLEQDPEVGLIFKIIDDHVEAHQELLLLNPDGKKPKYKDNLRLILKVNDEILFDGESPEHDGMIPLVPIYCYKVEDSIYGIGEVKHIKSIQESYNEMDWAELSGLRLVSNPGWVLDDNTGVDTNTLTNEPGIVVKKKQGTEVRRLEPGTVSPQLNSRKEFDRSAIEGISGINEATQGKRPTGITAAQAIRFLQEQSVGRIRLKTRYLEEYSMPRLGELVASRIINHWTVEKKLRVHDRNGQIKFIEFKPEEVQKLRYDIRMVPGSLAGIDKESIFNVMRELVTGGVIDARTFVELTDLPFKAKMLDKFAENDQTQAALEGLTLENETLKTVIAQLPPELLQQLPPEIIESLVPEEVDAQGQPVQNIDSQGVGPV